MKDLSTRKLWIVKFCLNIVYPKFNHYMFLIFLAIKYRHRYSKGLMALRRMDTFQLNTISTTVHRQLLKKYLDENLSVLENKCILISKEQYLQLASENLFYIDNGVLWLSLKLSENTRKEHPNKSNDSDNILKYSLDYVTSEIHKKLWSENNTASIENVRIVPVVGSNLIPHNIAYLTENELYSTASSFGLDCSKNIEVNFHPIPSLDNSPKIASTAEVSLIVDEDDMPNDYIKEVLNKHFETPKLLSLNDVFSIYLTPDTTAKLYFKCEKLSTYPMNSTKVGRFEVSQNNSISNVIQSYFIVKNVTQLTLGENIHSLKPTDQYFKPQPGGNKVVNLHSCPTGLRKVFEQLQESIHTFLSGDINDLSLSMSIPILPLFLLTGSTGSGRHLLVKAVARHNGMNFIETDCIMLQSTTAKQTERKIDSVIQKAKTSAPAVVMLNSFEVFAVDPEHNVDSRVAEYFMNSIIDLYENYTKHPIVFIAVSEKIDLKPNISRMFLEKFHLPKLNNQQRFETLHWLATAMQLDIDGEMTSSSKHRQDKTLTILNDEEFMSQSSKDVLQRVAAKTATFMYGDIDTLMHFAMRESYLKQMSNCNPSSDPDLRVVREEDFDSALETIRSLQSQQLDAPKIPKVYWEDIGGLDKLKRELLKTIEFPIKYPHLFKNSSLKRSGILLYGPPGCGKTLVAKAVSTELNVSFLSVKGPELLNMYIGQSEENVREVFGRARSASPCIVFLDELDALAPRRGAAGDSGGASDRVVSQLLAELDGVTTNDDADNTFVFVMGATNRPDLLEQSLLRPGRLDKLIYVGPYSGVDEKTCVLNALCRSMRLREEVDLQGVAAALPERCTGADLLHVVSTARSAAVRSLVHGLQADTVKESELGENSVIIGVSELWEGVKTFRPSVTDEELAYYESLQTKL